MGDKAGGFSSFFPPSLLPPLWFLSSASPQLSGESRHHLILLSFLFEDLSRTSSKIFVDNFREGCVSRSRSTRRGGERGILRFIAARARLHEEVSCCFLRRPASITTIICTRHCQPHESTLSSDEEKRHREGPSLGIFRASNLSTYSTSVPVPSSVSLPSLSLLV